jgi:type IV pilus assembly protein PilE
MRRSRGFTLLEILVVVAIIGILAAIAIPSYKKQVQRSNRANAQSFMLDVVNKQQIYLSSARAYAPDLATLQSTPPADVTKFYTLAIALVAGPPPSFTITATPIAGTMQETDGWIAIDSSQTKTSQYTDKW